MSQTHSLSDDQVANELKKMTAFIRQEALEKAKEIQIKADEEFAIEKSRLVREEIASIDNDYTQKFKQAGMSQQIARSTVANKSRLRVLAARQEVLDSMFEQARGRLKGIGEGKGGGGGGSKGSKGKGAGNYEDICKKLILEGMFFLNEKKMVVRARKTDAQTMKKAAEGAEKEYKDRLAREVHVQLDENTPLPDESSGGAIILGTSGKIDVQNTFEERLHLLETEALPAVRVILFGENEHRRFHD